MSILILLSCAPRKSIIPVEEAHYLIERWMKSRPNGNISGYGRFRVENGQRFTGTFEIQKIKDTLILGVFGPMGIMIFKGRWVGDSLFSIENKGVEISPYGLGALRRIRQLFLDKNFKPNISPPVVKEGKKIVIKAKENFTLYKFCFEGGKLVELKVMDGEEIVFKDFRELEFGIFPFKVMASRGRDRLMIEFSRIEPN
jgi:hypothetical protein